MTSGEFRHEACAGSGFRVGKSRTRFRGSRFRVFLGVQDSKVRV